MAPKLRPGCAAVKSKLHKIRTVKVLGKLGKSVALRLLKLTTPIASRPSEKITTKKKMMKLDAKAMEERLMATLAGVASDVASIPEVAKDDDRSSFRYNPSEPTAATSLTPSFLDILPTCGEDHTDAVAVDGTTEEAEGLTSIQEGKAAPDDFEKPNTAASATAYSEAPHDEETFDSGLETTFSKELSVSKDDVLAGKEPLLLAQSSQPPVSATAQTEPAPEPETLGENGSLQRIRKRVLQTKCKRRNSPTSGIMSSVTKRPRRKVPLKKKQPVSKREKLTGTLADGGGGGGDGDGDDDDNDDDQLLQLDATEAEAAYSDPYFHHVELAEVEATSDPYLDLPPAPVSPTAIPAEATNDARMEAEPAPTPQETKLLARATGTASKTQRASHGPLQLEARASLRRAASRNGKVDAPAATSKRAPPQAPRRRGSATLSPSGAKASAPAATSKCSSQLPVLRSNAQRREHRDAATLRDGGDHLLVPRRPMPQAFGNEVASLSVSGCANGSGNEAGDGTTTFEGSMKSDHVSPPTLRTRHAVNGTCRSRSPIGRRGARATRRRSLTAPTDSPVAFEQAMGQESIQVPGQTRRLPPPPPARSRSPLLALRRPKQASWRGRLQCQADSIESAGHSNENNSVPPPPPPLCSRSRRRQPGSLSLKGTDRGRRRMSGHGLYHEESHESNFGQRYLDGKEQPPQHQQGRRDFRDGKRQEHGDQPFAAQGLSLRSQPYAKNRTFAQQDASVSPVPSSLRKPMRYADLPLHMSHEERFGRTAANDRTGGSMRANSLRFRGNAEGDIRGSWTDIDRAGDGSGSRTLRQGHSPPPLAQVHADLKSRVAALAARLPQQKPAAVKDPDPCVGHEDNNSARDRPLQRTRRCPSESRSRSAQGACSSYSYSSFSPQPAPRQRH